jgi:replication factor C subunit 3/5
LEDLVAHEDIISIISNLIDNDNLPHLLLYGPPGTGKVSELRYSPLECCVEPSQNFDFKTSTIVAAAKKMYGDAAYSSMALELNASDARGIDVRNLNSKFID